MILFINRVTNDGGIRNTITTVSVDGRDMKPVVDAESTGVYSSNHLLFHRAGKLFAQQFDAIELRLSGEAVMVADGVSNDAPGTAGLVGFDAIDGLLVSRPRIGSSVIHLLFNWPATLAR